MIADPRAAAVVKVALDNTPETPHVGVTAILALEEIGYRVVTVDQIRQALDDIERWRGEAERKQTLRSEIEQELGLTDVDPDHYMDAALEAIRAWKARAELAELNDEQAQQPPPIPQHAPQHAPHAHPHAHPHAQ